jgi:hypothetical protein
MSVFGVLLAIVGVAVVAFLFAQLRARKIRERYVWLWLILLIGMGAITVIPGLATSLANLLGFQLVSNLLLTAAAVVTFLITVSLSAEASRLHMSVRSLSEEAAFLRTELDARDDQQRVAHEDAVDPGERDGTVSDE